jgi:TPR repeat protein
MADNEEKELLKKARKGNVEAMFELANLYSFEGRNDEAQKWYKKAAKRGHAGAKKSKKGFRLPKRPSNGCGIYILGFVLIVIAVVVLCILFPWFFELIKWVGAIIGAIIGIIFISI